MSHKNELMKILSSGNANKAKTNKERLMDIFTSNDTVHQTSTASTPSASSSSFSLDKHISEAEEKVKNAEEYAQRINSRFAWIGDKGRERRG